MINTLKDNRCQKRTNLHVTYYKIYTLRFKNSFVYNITQAGHPSHDTFSKYYLKGQIYQGPPSYFNWVPFKWWSPHYNDVIMSAMAYKFTSLTILYSTVYSRRKSKKTSNSKLRVTGLCAGNSPATGEFPAQRTSNAENVSIWWRQSCILRPVCSSPANQLFVIYQISWNSINLVKIVPATSEHFVTCLVIIIGCENQE